MAKALSVPVLGSQETIAVPRDIFGLSWNAPLVSQYMRVYFANQKRNTSHTKTRGEVAGTTKKIYKQKGTGRARHGSAKAPIFIGGGSAHGPKGMDAKAKMPQKMRQKALFVTLSQKLHDKHLIVAKDSHFAVTKTAEANAFLAKNKLESKKALIILAHQSPAKKAFANLSGTVSEPSGINAHTVYYHTNVIFSESALRELCELYKRQ